MQQQNQKQDEKIKQLQGQLERNEREAAEEKGKLNGMIRELERIGNENQSKLKNMNKKYLGRLMRFAEQNARRIEDNFAEFATAERTEDGAEEEGNDDQFVGG